MKIKQKILTLVVILAVSVGICTSASVSVSADCGGVKTSIITCTGDSKSASAKDNPIWQILLLGLNILAGGVGIAAVGGVVYGAILYSSAADNAAQTKKALEVIRNVVIGIVAYGLMYMVLNYLIPGGIFS